MNQFKNTREIMVYAQKYIKGRALDLGAGSGKYRNIIKQNAKEYVAFDMAPGKNIDIVGDALNLPFNENTFDTVVSTQVLEHVEKPWVMAKEIGRVLKQGGICIITAPFLEPYHQDPGDFFRYSTQGIQSLFRNENFEVIECATCGSLFSVISEFFRFLWFNPFKKAKKGTYFATRLMSNLANFLDRFANNKIIYSDVYIIARKK
ncbi:MAG: methyltransferase domain-containing protein [Candidatus Omnitrophica bacterium]|nr:methyltransferase domain-containing protein [Candidatus Omnitrophota bacterium]